MLTVESWTATEKVQRGDELVAARVTVPVLWWSENEALKDHIAVNEIFFLIISFIFNGEVTGYSYMLSQHINLER